MAFVQHSKMLSLLCLASIFGISKGLSLKMTSNPFNLPSNVKFTGIRKKTHLNNDGAIMPDGGLNPCIIKVIGVGGGGCNAVDRMLDTGVGGVDFWALNTDSQALGRSYAKGAKVLNIGGKATRGLGAGGNPEIGRLAAEESRRELEIMVKGSDLCFITSGMGGGTGSGAAPVVAEVAKESGCLTLGIVTKPFRFEGKRRMDQAEAAIERLKEHVDTVILVSNERLLRIIPDDTPMEQAFTIADDILRQGVVGISEIIIKPGLINVDFADVRSVMSNAGTALMGIGLGFGKNAAEDAARAAITSPLLDTTIDNASGVVFNICGGPYLSLGEVSKAAKLIYASVNENANVIFGALTDDDLGDTISITVLATGFDGTGIKDFKREDTYAPPRPSNVAVPPMDKPVVRPIIRPAPKPVARPAATTIEAQEQEREPRPAQPMKQGDDNVPDFLRNLKKKK
jgi:cell division protein FtsZ